MIRERNAGLLTILFLAAVLTACQRPPGAGGPGKEGPPPPPPAERPSSPGRPAAPAPAGAPGSRSAVPEAQPPALRPAPQDRLLGTRPLARLFPSDFELGPLEGPAESSPDSRAAAAAPVRAFLDGLAEGRVEGTVPEARDVILFMMSDLLAEDFRPGRRRLAEGIPRPEGGWIFPFLLDDGTRRIRGEALVGETDAGWGIELVILRGEENRAGAAGGPGSFDPTIRTVKPTGR